MENDWSKRVFRILILAYFSLFYVTLKLNGTWIESESIGMENFQFGTFWMDYELWIITMNWMVEWHGLMVSIEACHSKGPEFKSSSGRFFWGDINHIKKTLIIWHENDKNTLSASNVEILLIWNIAKRSGRWIWSQVTWERKKKMVCSMWEVWLNG